MKIHNHNPYTSQTATAPAITDRTVPVDGPLRLVAWVDRYPPFQNAGGEWALHGILTQLAARGHSVQVATHSMPETGDPCLVFEGVTVWPDSAAPRLLDQADVMISHLLWTDHAVQAAHHGQVPLLYLFHNDFTIGSWHLVPKNVTAVGYNAKWVRASILEKNPRWQALPSVVAHPAVTPGRMDADCVDPAGRDRITLVNVNQLKGAELFYELARARPRDLFLGVEGAYGQQLRPRRKDQNVAWQAQTVDMPGDVFARTRVLLAPSEYESYGLAAVEAMAARIPVVANPTPGLREALGDAGLWANRNRPAEWHAHLDALADPGFYAERADMARARALELEDQAPDEVDAFEALCRRAAGADRSLPSAGMAGHDPFRAKRRHGRSVDIAAPVAQEEPRVPVDWGAHADAPTAADGPVPTDQAVIVGHVIEDSESLIATTNQQGVGAEGEASGGDAGGASETSVSTTTPGTGDGPGSQDAGRPSPEPTPASNEAPAAGDGPQPVAPAGPLPDDERVAALVPEVPPQAQKVRDWVTAGADEAERYDRAAAAEWVENHRPGANRKMVTAAINPVLYE